MAAPGTKVGGILSNYAVLLAARARGRRWSAPGSYQPCEENLSTTVDLVNSSKAAKNLPGESWLPVLRIGVDAGRDIY
jgi:hypothetical protein